MTGRVLGDTHPSEPDRQAEGDETQDAKPRSNTAASSVPSSTDDTAPSQRPAAGAELGAPESYMDGGASGGSRVVTDSDATRVMSTSARLAALVAQTRIRTGKYPAAESGKIGQDPLGSESGTANAPLRPGHLDPPPQTIGEAEPTEKSQAAPGAATIDSTIVPMRSGQLDPARAPQTIGEAEPTEKSEAPGAGAESSPFGEAVNADAGPTIDVPGVAPSRRRTWMWKAGMVVVTGALVWFAVIELLPRYRIPAGSVPGAVHQAEQPIAPAGGARSAPAVKEAQPTVPSPPTAEPPAASAPTPTPAEPVAPPSAGAAERSLPAGSRSRAKSVGAATPRPASHAHSRSKAKAGRPARSVAEDPDAVLSPGSPSPQPDAQESSAQHKLRTTKRP